MKYIFADFIINIMKKKLSFNKKQHLMIYRVFNHFLQINNSLFINQFSSQFLLYVDSKKNVRKSKIIQVLKQVT